MSLYRRVLQMQQDDNEWLTNSRDEAYNAYMNVIRNKIGKKLLSDDELIALAFDEISKTFTREERNYN